MWLVDSFCVGAVRHSARLFGASGRHSGQTLMPLDLQSAHSNFTRPFLFRSALIRGSQSGATQHRVATDSPVWAISPFRSSLELCPVYLVPPLQGCG